jgi:hypothetical protein
MIMYSPLPFVPLTPTNEFYESRVDNSESSRNGDYLYASLTLSSQSFASYPPHYSPVRRPSTALPASAHNPKPSA